jgi:hypothetical protein
MKHLAFIAPAFAAGAMLAAGAPASAQSNRTFVSGQGADTGGCALTAPCRSFAYAITVTNAGGEMVVLTSAGYGTVTINKAISISNQEGVEAAVTVTSGDGITVAAGTSDVVNLRGLTLIGQSTAGNGITLTSGGTLNIQNTVITGFSSMIGGGVGLNLTPGGSSLINISDTIVADNDDRGIYLAPTGTGAKVQAFFERVQVLGNGTGFSVDGTAAASSTTIQATAADCVANGNHGGGFIVSANGGTAQPTFTLVNGKSANNFDGLLVFGGTMIAAETTTAGNDQYGFGIFAGGALESFGNNYITESSNTGALTPISQQ